MEPLALKRNMPIGSSIAYDLSDAAYSLDTLCLEWSGIGKGDYRDHACRDQNAGRYVYGRFLLPAL